MKLFTGNALYKRAAKPAVDSVGDRMSSETRFYRVICEFR